jgi:LEA14-like dessication related protein
MGRVTSLLFGSTLRIVLVGVLGLGVSVGALFSVGVLGVPSVVGVDNAFGDVNETTTEIETDLTVDNPNPVGARLGDLSVNYTVNMNEVEMASGTKRGLGIGSGNTTLAFTTAMSNERIPAWWASHVRNGEQTDVSIDVRAQSGLLGRTFEAPPVERNVTTDLLSSFNSTETREVNANQPGVEDPVLYVNRTSAAWGDVSRDRTEIRLEFVVYNPKATPMPITELGYNVTMNDVAVGDGRTDEEYVIPAKDTQTIQVTTTIDNSKLDEWWVSHLQRNQVTDLRIEFHGRVDTVAGTVSVPFDPLTHTETIETDIFGSKASNGTDGDATDDETTTTSDESDSTDGGDSSTTTTTTTTDDGGLLDDRRARPVAP